MGYLGLRKSTHPYPCMHVNMSVRLQLFALVPLCLMHYFPKPIERLFSHIPCIMFLMLRVGIR